MSTEKDREREREKERDTEITTRCTRATLWAQVEAQGDLAGLPATPLFTPKQTGQRDEAFVDVRGNTAGDRQAARVAPRVCGS